MKISGSFLGRIKKWVTNNYLRNNADDTFNGQLTITHNTSSKPLVKMEVQASTQLFLLQNMGSGLQTFLEGGASIGLFGTYTRHNMHIRTNYVTRVDIDKDGVYVDIKNMKIKNPKNLAASALSGTKKVIEIDISGVPYYFEVYPTKA